MTNREYYLKNREKEIKRAKKYHKLNREMVLAKKKLYRKKNAQKIKEYGAEWRKNNKELHKKLCDKWRKANKQKIDQYDKEYKKTRYYTDNLYRLKSILRRRISIFFKRYPKTGSAVRDLGCSVLELKTYIENKFTNGMTWDNYGEWHVDHIIPLASAKSSDELIKLCHYTNLQPLWASENLKKGAKCA